MLLKYTEIHFMKKKLNKLRYVIKAYGIVHIWQFYSNKAYFNDFLVIVRIFLPFQAI